MISNSSSASRATLLYGTVFLTGGEKADGERPSVGENILYWAVFDFDFSFNFNSNLDFLF